MKTAVVTCNAFALLIVLSIVLVIEFRNSIDLSNIPLLHDASDFLVRHSRIRYLKDEPMARNLQAVGHLLPTHTTGHHFNHTAAGHKRAWMHFQEVDGLKNEEVIMFVMSSTIRDGYLLRERSVTTATVWVFSFDTLITYLTYLRCCALLQGDSRCAHVDALVRQRGCRYRRYGNIVEYVPNYSWLS